MLSNFFSAMSKEKLVNAASLMGARLGHFDFDFDAEVAQTTEEPLFRLFDVAVGEVGAAKVDVFDAIAQHEIRGGEHRGGDGDNGFLRPAAAL